MQGKYYKSRLLVSCLVVITVLGVMPLKALAVPRTCTWTGNADTNRFTNAGNWDCTGGLKNGDAVVFNADSVKDGTSFVNDFTDLQINSLTQTSDVRFMTISGGTLGVTSSIETTNLELQAPLRLDGAVTFHGVSLTRVGMDLNNNTLIVRGNFDTEYVTGRGKIQAVSGSTIMGNASIWDGELEIFDHTGALIITPGALGSRTNTATIHQGGQLVFMNPNGAQVPQDIVVEGWLDAPNTPSKGGGAIVAKNTTKDPRMGNITFTGRVLLTADTKVETDGDMRFIGPFASKGTSPFSFTRWLTTKDQPGFVTTPHNYFVGGWWPQKPGENITVTYQYIGDLRALTNNVNQATANLNAVAEHVRLAPSRKAQVILRETKALEDDVYAETTYANDCLECLYSHNYVVFSQATMNPLPENVKTKMATHEFGHVLGLDHPPSTDSRASLRSIMWQGENLPYYVPQLTDIEHLRKLYP